MAPSPASARSPSEVANFRRALLTQARAAVDLHACPPPVRACAAQFEDAVEVQVRRILVGSQPFYEVLTTFTFEDDDEEEPREFVSGLIIDFNGEELVDLDFEQQLATFVASPEERAQDEAFAKALDGLFTKQALDGGSLKPLEIPLPKQLVEVVDGASDEAIAYRLDLGGRRGYAKVSRIDGKWEVLVFDEKYRPLGGTIEAGVEPFDIGSIEETAPLTGGPRSASTEKKGNDVFEGARKPKVVF